MITNIDATHKSTPAKSVQPHSLLAKWFLLEQATINSDLSSSAKSVLATLLFYHNTKTGRSFVGEDTIAARLRLSTRQVQRCVRELQQKGWIVAERRFNKTSEYEFEWSRAVPVNKRRQSDDDMDVGSVHDAGVSSNHDMDVIQ
jgi:predicted transcriptional regulator